MYRRLLRERGINPRARRGVAHGSGPGKVRWVVERAFAWLHAFKRLRTVTSDAQTSTSAYSNSSAP
jgi:transposase